MNRGLEISADAADAANSLILDQVAAGVSVRMSVLSSCWEAASEDLLIRGADLVGHGRSDLLIRDGRFHRSGGRRRAVERLDADGLWLCQAWLTCTRICGSRDGKTPRPSIPAQWRRRAAASRQCWRWLTPTLSPTPLRPPYTLRRWGLGMVMRTWFR